MKRIPIEHVHVKSERLFGEVAAAFEAGLGAFDPAVYEQLKNGADTEAVRGRPRPRRPCRTRRPRRRGNSSSGVDGFPDRATIRPRGLPYPNRTALPELHRPNWVHRRDGLGWIRRGKGPEMRIGRQGPQLSRDPSLATIAPQRGHTQHSSDASCSSASAMILPTGSSVDSSSRGTCAAPGASEVSNQSVSMAGGSQFGSKRRERGSKLMVDVPDGLWDCGAAFDLEVARRRAR